MCLLAKHIQFHMSISSLRAAKLMETMTASGTGPTWSALKGIDIRQQWLYSRILLDTAAHSDIHSYVIAVGSLAAWTVKGSDARDNSSMLPTPLPNAAVMCWQPCPGGAPGHAVQAHRQARMQWPAPCCRSVMQPGRLRLSRYLYCCISILLPGQQQ